MSLSGCRCVCTSLTDNTQCHPNRFVAVLNEQLTYHNVTSWAISVTTQAEDEVTRRGYNHEEVLVAGRDTKIVQLRACLCVGFAVFGVTLPPSRSWCHPLCLEAGNHEGRRSSGLLSVAHPNKANVTHLVLKHVFMVHEADGFVDAINDGGLLLFLDAGS